MKLHALDGQRFMAQPHDFAVVRPGSDFQRAGQGSTINGERVIARADQRIRQAAKDARIVMMNRRRLAVHLASGVDDPSAEGFANRQYLLSDTVVC